MQSEILKTEYSEHFDALRRERMKAPNQKEAERFNNIRKSMMIVSYYKYGPVKENYDTYKCLDAIGNIRKRLEKYRRTFNTEFLADVANFAMIEFMYPTGNQSTYIPLIRQYECREEEKTLDIIDFLLDEYECTHDSGLLADIANMAFQEFAYPSYEQAKYMPTDNNACELAGFSINEIKGYDR